MPTMGTSDLISPHIELWGQYGILIDEHFVQTIAERICEIGISD